MIQFPLISGVSKTQIPPEPTSSCFCRIGTQPAAELAVVSFPSPEDQGRPWPFSSILLTFRGSFSTQLTPGQQNASCLAGFIVFLGLAEKLTSYEGSAPKGLLLWESQLSGWQWPS